MTPRTLEQNIQKAVKGNKQAKQQISSLWQQQISKIDTKKYTSNEAITRMQTLINQGKVPSYVLEKGYYRYIEGNNMAYVIGEKVFMRSQPNTQARILKKTNTNTTTYLTYLGEWKHPKTGNRWVCVRNPLGEIGWIFGQYIQLVPNEKFQDIISQIKGKSATNEDNKNTSKAKPKAISVGNSLKIVSIENILNKTLKRYSVYGFIIWGIAFLITFSLPDWKIDFDHILKFIFWTIAIVAGTVLAYFVIYYIIWKAILLPILEFIVSIIAGIFFLMAMGNNGCGKTNCPFYPKHNCNQCNSCRYA